jgi:hypothetical protein
MKFDRELFHQDSMYVMYDGRFVARFKYQKSGMGSFISFLRKHFTVEEYFSRMDAGEAPLTILESKGYILPHIRRILKQHGYDPTREGFKQYLFDQRAK